MAEGRRVNKRASIVLISKTGGGKSSLANALLSTTEFPVSRGLLSGTVYCKCISTYARGRDLTVVDTPGTMDVEDEERAKAEINRAISFCPDGFDIFLVVVKCDARFTKEERLAIEIAADMFGERFYTHAIVVFSHGDDYDNDEDEFKRDLVRFRQSIPFLDGLLKKCGDRFLLVDTGRKADKTVQDRQVEALLSLVDSVMKRNSDRKYTNEHFESERRTREEEERRRAEGEERRRQAERNQIREEMEAEMEARSRMAREREERDWREAKQMEAQRQREMIMGLAGGLLKLGMMSIAAMASVSSQSAAACRENLMITFESDSAVIAIDSSDDSDSD